MPYNRDRLGYPFNYRTLLAQDSTRVFTPGDPAVPGDCNWYVLQVTNEERKKLQSALLAGLDLLYPDEFLDLMQIWLQTTDYPNTFPPSTGACDDVELCELILNCINNTESIQQAIAGYSLGSAISETTPENATILASDFVQEQGCDDDNLFGMTTGLTDFLNQVSEDILEILVTAPAALGRLGDLISAIPVVETLPLDEALQFAEKLATQVNDAYQAAYDTQIRDDFRCELFCIAQENCELTMEQTRNYFKDKITNAVSNTDFLTIANDIIANNWLGEQSIYMMHWMILDTFIFGGEILGIDHNRVVYQVAAMFNDPDPDWAILCASCVETWEYSIDFTLTPGFTDGWAVGNWGDGWVLNDGFQSQHASSAQENNYLNLTFPQESTVTYIEFTFASSDHTNFDSTSGGFITGGYILDGSGTETHRETSSNKAINTTYVIYDGTPIQADVIRTQNNPYLATGKWYITGCTIRGEGVDPYA